MRTWVFWGVTAVVLAVTNGLIAHKESVLRSGQTMFLELAPVDPRSLIQGDYMVLRYKLARDVGSKVKAPSGHLVVTLDERQVATFVRVHGGEALADGERLLRFRRRRHLLRLGAESFFFQEGHARHYENAKFGELRVAPSGNSVLVGLRDKNLQPLGPP